MIGVIEECGEEIKEVCRRYGVSKLEVFGSAVDGEFEEDRSDVDFLVEFLPGQVLGPGLSHYFDLKVALERLLGRTVDLVMYGAMKNPHFIREVNRTRRTVYAA